MQQSKKLRPSLSDLTLPIFQSIRKLMIAINIQPSLNNKLKNMISIWFLRGVIIMTKRTSYMV